MREIIINYFIGCIAIVCLYGVINAFVPPNFKKSFLVFVIVFNILVLPMSILFAGYGIFSAPDLWTATEIFIGSFLLVQIVPLVLYFVSLACYSYSRKRNFSQN